MSLSKYVLNLLAATILPPVLAVVAVMACSVLTDTLHIGVAATTYERIGATPPFVLQILFGLSLGFLLSKRIGHVKSARWVWLIPAAWMLVGIATWHPFTVSSLSRWEYFFSSQLVPTSSIALAVSLGHRSIHAYRAIVYVSCLFSGSFS